MLSFVSEERPTVCQFQYRQQNGNAVPGAFVPRCRSDGSYDDVQCRGSVCYCVDRRGHELRGTRVNIGEGTPQCATPGKYEKRASTDVVRYVTTETNFGIRLMWRKSPSFAPYQYVILRLYKLLLRSVSQNLAFDFM